MEDKKEVTLQEYIDYLSKCMKDCIDKRDVCLSHNNKLQIQYKNFRCRKILAKKFLDTQEKKR